MTRQRKAMLALEIATTVVKFEKRRLAEGESRRQNDWAFDRAMDAWTKKHHLTEEEEEEVFVYMQETFERVGIRHRWN